MPQVWLLLPGRCSVVAFGIFTTAGLFAFMWLLQVRAQTGRKRTGAVAGLGARHVKTRTHARRGRPATKRATARVTQQ